MESKDEIPTDTYCEDTEGIEPAVSDKYLRSGGSACPWCNGDLEAEQ